MSSEQKQNFDVLFKIFIGVMVTFFGWLANRTVNQFDSVKASIDITNITIGEMRKDIEWLKNESNKNRQ